MSDPLANLLRNVGRVVTKATADDPLPPAVPHVRGRIMASTGLHMKIADASLVRRGNGLAVNLATGGGLTLSNGVAIKGLPIVAADPGAPAAGDVWFNTAGVAGKLQLGAGLVGSMVLNLATWPLAVTVNANTVKQVFGTNTIALPAGFLNHVGRTLRIRLHLRMNAAALANGFTFNVELSASVIATFGLNVGLGAAIDSAVDVAVTTRTTGAAGTLFTSTMDLSAVPVIAAGLPTLDLTAAQTLQFSASANTTNAGDNSQILFGSVELVA